MVDRSLSGHDVHARRVLLGRLYYHLLTVIGPTGWWPADTPFEVCVGAILTQSAPWTGVTKALDALKVAGLMDADALAAADPGEIAPLIRPSIYYNQKALRLGTFCRYLRDRYGGDPTRLASLSIDSARSELLSLTGIGRETADCILCYAAGLPVFVIDEYTHRVAGRHGLTDSTVDYDMLRTWFEDAVDPDPVRYGEFHALLCITGARWCRKSPRCGTCPVRDILGEPNL